MPAGICQSISAPIVTGPHSPVWEQVGYLAGSIRIALRHLEEVPGEEAGRARETLTNALSDLADSGREEC